MATLPISRRFTVLHIPHSFRHRYHSKVGACWPNAVLSHVTQARPYLGLKAQPGIGLPTAIAPFVSQTYTQQRYNSSKFTPPSPGSFGKHEAAKKRRQEETDDKNKRTELSSHPNAQQDVHQDRKPNREQKEDKEAKDDPRKEAVEDKQGLKTFRPARLPIVLCHGK